MTATDMPPWTPVVYLRGAGRGQTAWTHIQRACWARGWHTVSSRTDAWHLARGGCPVVMCDFSIMHLPQHVGRVQAKYGTDPTTGGQELLLTMASRFDVSYRSRDDTPKLMAAIGNAFEGKLAAVTLDDVRRSYE